MINISTKMQSPFIFLISYITLLSTVFHHLKCQARDSIISGGDPLIDTTNETLVSEGKRFELGFFTPDGNEKGSRYIGIWYYDRIPRTIVWVACRETPLADTSGVIGIADNGNVKLWNRDTLFCIVSDATNSMNLNRTLKLLDSGNLILFVDGSSGPSLWQSFDHPTDTFLPGMRMDDKTALRSWISPSDPAAGNYTFLKDQTVYSIQNRLIDYWRSGDAGSLEIYNYLPGSIDQMFTGLNQTIRLSTAIEARPRVYARSLPIKARPIDYARSLPRHTNPRYVIARVLMNYSGQIQYFEGDNGGGWLLIWSEPNDTCKVYEPCGKSANCDSRNQPICQCLPGFKPQSKEDWDSGRYSEGCVKEESVSCQDDADIMKRFSNSPVMKVESTNARSSDMAWNKKACENECLNVCTCRAYMYISDNRTSRETGNAQPNCWIWTQDITNLQIGDNPHDNRIYIREPDSALTSTRFENKNSMEYVIVSIVSVAGVLLILCCINIARRTRFFEGKGNIEKDPVIFSHEYEGQANELMNIEKDSTKAIDVPFYSLNIVLSATDEFSDANKLGRGGFGPVYKGKFPGGQEMAVKRLSSCSGQGLKEFQNEVVLISKLQHRNLVRLLGYSLNKHEKILLYEYMPNRSLDAFIFDQENRLLLDWKKRFDIILGIARGLLYLHQDSRLRVIHRDLKTSNILLDENMNPKISDFGLARIVEGKGAEASTKNVVGTLGYISPEYALEGKFSTKSDVFSFGVVLLEIVSGKKNTGFYNPEHVLTLLRYAWILWTENKALDLTDPTLVETCDASQVIKCINIGLLCVQEDPGDRPTMSNVVIMLDSETSPLPPPTQPAFVARRRLSVASSSSSSKPADSISNNELTISMDQGR